MIRTICLAIIALIATPVWAQFTQRSGLTGLVTDQSGAAMPNVTVTVTDLDRNQRYTTTTNESGLYSFSNLTAGRYQVSIEQPGFRKMVSDVIALAGQDTSRLDLTLQVGAVTETVEVTASPGLLQTEEAVVGALADRNLVEFLPMKGRNFTALAALTPNISSFPRGNSGGTWAIGGDSVIGGVDFTPGGGGDKGFYINGVNTNDNWMGTTNYAPSVEAIAEVKVDVTNFSAASGRDVSTLQVATRGGTSELHGTAYDYLQNSALNAWNPYSKALAEPGQKKSMLQRNQFGFNVGGPVVLPKIYDGRDRLFFFFNYEGMRESRGAQNMLYRVPTAAEREGDFSSWLTRFPGDPNYLLWDPFSTVVDAEGNTTRQPIPNNDIRNIGRVNPQAKEMLGIFPEPSGYVNPSNPLDLRNHRMFIPNKPSSNQFDARVDFRATDGDNFYVSINRSAGLRPRPDRRIFPDMPGDVDDTNLLLTVNYARVFTPTLTNEFIFAWGSALMNNIDRGTQDYMRRTDTLRNKYFKNLGTDIDFGHYAMGISGLPTVGFYEFWWTKARPLQFSDNVNWVRNNHQFKFGFNYFRKEEFGDTGARGVWFDNVFSRAGNVLQSRGGDGLASFLMGLPTSIEQRYDIVPRTLTKGFVIPYWAFFGEDRYQVTKNLTLNMGVRLEIPQPMYAKYKTGNAVMDFDYPGWQLKIPGRAEGLPLHYMPSPKNVAPRIALAYRTKWDTVIRASYGIFYSAGFSLAGESNLDRAFGAVPGVLVMDEYNSARFGLPDDVPYLTFSDIFPAQQQIGVGAYPISTGPGTGYFDYRADVYYRDKDSSRTPYYQRYVVEIQKGLGSDSVVSVAYNGGRGTRLPMWDNLNQAPYRTGWPSTSVFNEARPNNNGRFGDVWVLRHGLDSFYNAATIKFERRFSKGLQFLSHYTFSKTVEERDMRYSRQLGRGEADFSHPHRFVAALTYQIPWGASLPRLAKTLLWGWQVSSITTFESGNSLTPGNAVTSARDRESNRPNVSGNPNLPRGERTFYRYFDTSVFSAPPQDVKGNAGPGIIRGPGMNNWDISLSKTFAPLERLKAEFRADLFNAFNHAQWSGVNTTFDDRAGNTFGRVTGAREPRIVQLGLRLRF